MITRDNRKMDDVKGLEEATVIEAKRENRKQGKRKKKMNRNRPTVG